MVLQQLPVIITEKALKEIKDIFYNKNIPAHYGLRLGVKGSGCTGIGFLLGFDIQQEQDKVYDVEGIKVLITKKDVMHLLGKKVDFVDEEARGFVFVDE
jgi:iron-sulfur cluster assembly protein